MADAQFFKLATKFITTVVVANVFKFTFSESWLKQKRSLRGHHRANVFVFEICMVWLQIIWSN